MLTTWDNNTIKKKVSFRTTIYYDNKILYFKNILWKKRTSRIEIFILGTIEII